MSGARTPGAYVLLFYLCFFLLLSSGRIASLDAGHQLQASVMLAVTGGLGDDGTIDGPANEAWVPAPNGRRYQAHDIGNIILMLPAAWLGARLSDAAPVADMHHPPLLSRVLVSLTCAAMAALGCWWLFKLFGLYWNARTAFLFSIVFPTTTIFVAYARAAWDVLGGAVMVCGLLYYSGAVLRGVRPHRSTLLVAATVAGACSFRFSLAPFLVPAAAAVILAAWRRGRHGPATPRFDVPLVAPAVLFAVLMVPSFVYNFIRTGSPLVPATASEQYWRGSNALTGDAGHGLYGLLISPNRGVFLFCPVLLFALAIPFVWRRLQDDQRILLACFAAGTAGYMLLIARVQNWGAFGWGPRYLVPVLPVFFAAAILGAAHLGRAFRPLVAAAVVFSAALTVPPALVNWHLATTTFDGAADPDAPLPYQQVAGWRTLAMGLRGETLPIGEDIAADPALATTADFPDLLLARVARHSRVGLLAALFTGIAAVSLAASSARAVLASGAAGPTAVRGS